MLKKVFTAVLAAVLFSGSMTALASQSDSTPSSQAQSSSSQALEAIDNTGEPRANTKIIIGYNGGLCTSVPALAFKKGFFKDEGLDVEIVKVQAGKEAIGTGKVDILTNHIASLLVPAVNGVNMKFAVGAHTGCKSLYVLTDQAYKTTSDLKGKTVGLPDGIGDSDHNIALRFFNHDKIDPKEIKFKPVEQSAVIQAMQSGDIQAAILSDQFAEKFVKDGTIRYIRSLTYDGDFRTEPCCVHAFNGDFLKDNPKTAAKVARAIMRGKEWTENNKEEAVKILFENEWASGDPELALRMMESYNFMVTQEETETALKNILNDYKSFGIITSGEDTDTLLNKIWVPLP